MIVLALLNKKVRLNYIVYASLLQSSNRLFKFYAKKQWNDDLILLEKLWYRTWLLIIVLKRVIVWGKIINNVNDYYLLVAHERECPRISVIYIK